MAFLEFIIVIAAGMATVITCFTLLLKSNEKRNVNEMKKVCKNRLDEIEDTGIIRRKSCMDIFKELKDNVQTVMFQNAGFEKDIKNLTEKIFEIKEKQEKIDGKIDKLMFLLPKRAGNHISE